ncbi:MAG: protein kinase [Phycisphaerales bacterium]|nr:protein kinase [Phycisphaerales bacterium]
MKQAEPCPHAAAVDRSVNETVSEEELTALANHLDECPTCRKSAMGNAQNESLLQALHSLKSIETQTSVDISVSMERLNDLFNNYEIIKEIGRGGMGIVYEARQLELDRNVALKVLPLMYSRARPDAVSQFRREAALAARLKHSNIIAIHDFGQIEGTLYYAMELVQGRSLRNILKEIEDTDPVDAVFGDIVTKSDASKPGDSAGVEPRRRRWPRSGSRTRLTRRYFCKVAEWTAQVAEALDYAHKNGVIHRDIKPSNLLVTADGRIMIADFGLACPVDEDDTLIQSIMGTCRYMSPEQVDPAQGPIDHRVDVYALGATMYELLAFESMFPVEDEKVLSQVLNQDPPSPHSIVPEVPLELETICLKAIAKKREARYDTAEAFANDLKRWLLNLPILAQRPSLSRRIVKFAQRRKLPVVAGATIVALVVASGLLFAGYRNWQKRAVEEQHEAWSHRVQQRLYDAQSDFNNGRLHHALAKIDATASAYPNEVEVQIVRAVTLHRLDRRKDAIDYLFGVLAKRPDRWPAHLLLAGIYNELGKNKREADQHADLAREFMPQPSAKTYYLQALCQTDAERAVDLLNKSLELDRTNAGALLTRCQRLFELKRYDAMLIDAERVVALKPRWAVSHGQLGRALRWLGRAEEAVYALNRAIELDPQRPQWWTDRSGARIYLRRSSQAIADANEAINLDSRFAFAYVLKGLSRANDGDVKGGLQDLDRAIRLNPDCAQAYIGRGTVLTRTGQWSQALADFDKAEKLDPGQLCLCDYSRACIHDHRGRCYLALGNNEQAIEELTRSIELPSPEWIDSHWARGVAAFRRFRFKDAISDFSRTLEKKPTLEFARLYRASSYEILGDYPLALRDYEWFETRTSTQLDAGYVRLFEYCLLRRIGRENAVFKSRTADKDWTNCLFDFLFGTVTQKQLIVDAVTDEQRADAYYFSGMLALLENRNPDAKTALSKCVALNTDTLVHDLARVRLRDLENPGN